MGFLSNFLAPAVHIEKRGTLSDIATISGVSSMTGVYINEMNSLRNMTVMACVGIISQSLASVPLILYERTGERERRRAVEHPLYRVLHDQGNREMTAFELRETRLAHCALWGNAYAEIEYDDQMNVVGLWPLAPDRVGIERNMASGQLQYAYYMDDGQGFVLPAWRVSHLRYMVIDGVVGISPIRQAMNAIGLAQATEEYGSKYFRNGARPSIILKHPAKLSKEAAERLRSSFSEKWSGLENAHRITILEEGVTADTVGIPPDEAQFLATRQFQVSEIARLYRVPQDMLADGSSTTYASAEQHSINLRVYTLLPWARRDEQALMRDLLTPSERERYYVEYLLDGLERADISTRSQAFNTMRQGGAITANEWRAAENMPPVDGGDVLLQPLNMAEVGSEPAHTEAPPDTPTDGARDAGNTSVTARDSALAYVFEDAAKRVLRRASQDIRKAGGSALRKGGVDGLRTWLDDFAFDLAPVVGEVMAPAVRAQAEKAGVDMAVAESELNSVAMSLARSIVDAGVATYGLSMPDEERLDKIVGTVMSLETWLAESAQGAAIGE